MHAKTEGKRRELEWKTRGEKEDGGAGAGGGGGRYVSTGYAGTLTPPDYPMNRNVIYGSFNELEGWRESRADRAIAYNTSRHVASPRSEIDPFARAYYTRDYTSTFNIIITRLHLLHKCIHHLPDAYPITLTPYRDPSTSVICEFYHDEGLNVHSVSSAIFITRDTGARFRYAAYACVRACLRCVYACAGKRIRTRPRA